MQKINTLCLILSSNQIEKILNIYRYYICEALEKYGSFTIINFNKTDIKKKIKYSKLFKKNEKKKIHLFQPKNKIEFIKFIENKKIIAIDNVGKDFKDFKFRWWLNKPNIYLVLLLDSGNISNENDFNSSDVENKIFYYSKKLNKIIYRLLILLNFFPKTKLYFDSRKYIYENYKNSKIRKIVNKFPFFKFLLNFQNVYKINSGCYENYHKFKQKNNLNNKNILFLDGNYKHPEILSREDINIKNTRSKYFKFLKEKFLMLERILKKKVEICLHPSSNLQEYRKFFKNFKIHKGKTGEKVFKSNIVLFHMSSSIMDAIISKKKIIILETDILGKYLSKRINAYKNMLKLPSIKLEEQINLKKSDVTKMMKFSKKNIDIFVKNNLMSDNKELPTKKFIRIIDYYIKNT